ncbi:uncharacterized protein LOC118175075 isoform X2 [Oxyura jamaicensis]|uniref:uncharacterized protein LOC118175075 isoform X2 n=1 Tax=Oxyura jamaicensis TaxID=8884 RepID=UPI0015A5366F|nr:uncharacterized protein LOC118175075 isoform X2 [Oxyura jamaicensis]
MLLKEMSLEPQCPDCLGALQTPFFALLRLVGRCTAPQKSGCLLPHVAGLAAALGIQWSKRRGASGPKAASVEPCPRSLILRFILPVCLLMVLPCLHPQGLIASHLSKCARCLKGVYRSAPAPFASPATGSILGTCPQPRAVLGAPCRRKMGLEHEGAKPGLDGGAELRSFLKANFQYPKLWECPCSGQKLIVRPSAVTRKKRQPQHCPAVVLSFSCQPAPVGKEIRRSERGCAELESC